jgi:hypothetical protein
MRALVVFESIFGNTRSVADAVADGLSGHANVDVVEVSAAPVVISGDIDLLVVGGPTHAFGLTRPATREDAARQAGRAVASIGLREWLAEVRSGSPRAVAATFDTRIKNPRLPGSAARGAERRLRKLGFPIAAPATSFYVAGTPGPLLNGEAERARRWGQKLAAQITTARPTS